MTTAVGSFMQTRGSHMPTHGPGNAAWEELHAKEMLGRQESGNTTGMNMGAYDAQHPVWDPSTGPYVPGDRMPPINPNQPGGIDPGFSRGPLTPLGTMPGDVTGIAPQAGDPGVTVNPPAPAPPGPWTGSQPNQPSTYMPPAPPLARSPQSPAMTYALWNQKHPGESAAQNRQSFNALGAKPPPRAIPGGAAPNSMSQPPAPPRANAIMPLNQTGR